MTISSETSRKTFAGNGSTTTFATSPMVFFDSEDLTVYVVTTETGVVVSTLVENVDYTVTGGAGGTGTISTAGGSDPHGAPATGTTLVLVREVAATQESDLVNNDGSDAEVIEDAFDRLTMGWQQLNTAISRAIRLSDADPVTELALPAISTRASKVLGFDATGGLTLYSLDAGATISADNVTGGVFPDEITQRGAGDAPYNTAFGEDALEANVYTVGLFSPWAGGDYNTANGKGALAANTDGRRNSAFGAVALPVNTTGYYNTATGAWVMNSNTTGYENTGAGVQALQFNTTGNRNTATGVAALNRNTTGERNAATGNDALQLNTTGSANTADGFQALLSNTTGSNNTASGFQALSANTTADNNSAHGTGALGLNTTGTKNTAQGAGAMAAVTTGANNTGVGRAAAPSLTTGDNNTAVGEQALPNVTTGSRNTALGQGAGPTTAALNDTVTVGRNAVTAIGGTGKIGNGLSDVNISGRIFGKRVTSAEATASGVTYSATQFCGTLINRSGPGLGFSDTTPTAAQIVAAIPGCEVGTGYEITIRNSAGFTLTMLAGSGVTLSGTTTVATVSARRYQVEVTNVDSGTEAVTVTGLYTAGL